MRGRERIVEDADEIAAIRAWVDARSDGWAENFLYPGGMPDNPPITIRACGQTHLFVYVDDDWLGTNAGKRSQRAICRGEWHQLEALLWP